MSERLKCGCCLASLKDPDVPVKVNLAKYAGPEARYCPVVVYEYVPNESCSSSVVSVTSEVSDSSANPNW